jgi:hypothetical protein
VKLDLSASPEKPDYHGLRDHQERIDGDLQFKAKAARRLFATDANSDIPSDLLFHEFALPVTALEALIRTAL